jgi:hypothetical protein
MTKEESKALIASAGGVTKFAELLGIEGEHSKQRVNNWKHRGIPPRVILENQDLLRRLKRNAS